MKRLLILICALLLAACADKDEYEKAVLAQMEKEQDLKDYGVAPAHMAACVVDVSAGNMPGWFGLDPARMTAYRNYTTMLTLMDQPDPKQAMERLRADFGSAQGLADARANYADSLLECYTALISKAELGFEEKPAKEPKPAVANPVAPALPPGAAQKQPAQPVLGDGQADDGLYEMPDGGEGAMGGLLMEEQDQELMDEAGADEFEDPR